MRCIAARRSSLRGFGSFRLRKREPRKGRNPKTGDKVDVPPKKVPYFKPGKELKDLINREAELADAADAAVGQSPQPLRHGCDAARGSGVDGRSDDTVRCPARRLRIPPPWTASGRPGDSST